MWILSITVPPLYDSLQLFSTSQKILGKNAISLYSIHALLDDNFWLNRRVKDFAYNKTLQSVNYIF